MGAAIARARERGFSSLTLWVLRENEQARWFYEALGFRRAKWIHACSPHWMAYSRAHL